MKFPFIEQTSAGQLVAKQDLSVVISKEMFTDGLAEIIDSGIKTFGFFDFRVYTNSDQTKWDTYKVSVPVDLIIASTDRREVGDDVLIDYSKGMVIIEKLTFIKNVDNVMSFFNFLTGGKIMASSQDELVRLFKENSGLNGVSLNAQSSLIEAMVSEMTRFAGNPSIPFRLAYGKKGVGPKDFVFVNIKNIARLSSVFSAISFEDINKAIQSAVEITRTDTEQTLSPVEDVLKF